MRKREREREESDGTPVGKTFFFVSLTLIKIHLNFVLDIIWHLVMVTVAK